MQHPDEGTIHAWIDGELAPDDAAALEAHLRECADCSALAAEARGLVAASSRIVSALDIVPGDVIPKTAPRPRPWYASTQLRAAAAVVIVAGASLLVMRNGGETRMERAVEASAPSTSATPSAAAVAPVVSETEADQVRPSNPPPRVVAKAPVPAPEVSTLRSKQKLDTEARSELRKREVASDAAANLHDEIAAAKPEARVDSVMRRRFNSSTSLEQAVITGVATASSGPTELKKVRADSVSNTTVYEASRGVEVTLADLGPRATVQLRAAVTAQSKERQATAPQAPNPYPPPPKRCCQGRWPE